MVSLNCRRSATRKGSLHHALREVSTNSWSALFVALPVVELAGAFRSLAAVDLKRNSACCQKSVLILGKWQRTLRNHIVMGTSVILNCGYVMTQTVELDWKKACFAIVSLFNVEGDTQFRKFVCCCCVTTIVSFFFAASSLAWTLVSGSNWGI